MRKTKILKRLVATTFALALVLSGILPGMEPLEVQAKTVDSNELYNIEVFMKDDGMSIPAHFEPPVRTLRATIPTNESQYSRAWKLLFRTWETMIPARWKSL